MSAEPCPACPLLHHVLLKRGILSRNQRREEIRLRDFPEATVHALGTPSQLAMRTDKCQRYMYTNMPLAMSIVVLACRCQTDRQSESEER